MKSNQLPVQVSTIGAAAFFILLAVGGAASAVIGHPAPLAVCGVIGLYLLFALKVADQLRPMDPRIFADGAMGLRTSFTG